MVLLKTGEKISYFPESNYGTFAGDSDSAAPFGRQVELSVSSKEQRVRHRVAKSRIMGPQDVNSQYRMSFGTTNYSFTSISDGFLWQ